VTPRLAAGSESRYRPDESEAQSARRDRRESAIGVEIIPVGLVKRKLAGRMPQELDAAGLTVRELLLQLPIKPELVAFVVVNGRLVRRDHRLSDNDVVKLVPAVGGG